MDNKLLECPICIDTFNNPRVLPCGHSICEECLINIIKNNSKSIQGRLVMTCPECRFVFIIKNISNIPLNITLKNIIDKENNLNTNSNLKEADSYFLCGPGEMIDNVNQFLLDFGVNQSKIHFERFYTEDLPKKDIEENNEIVQDIISNVTVSVDGDDFSFELSSKGETILDAAMNAGADVPFSCKGGVCCVCKAKVLEGNVKMDQNYSLSEEEVIEFCRTKLTNYKVPKSISFREELPKSNVGKILRRFLE